MRFALVILIVAMVVKDASHLGDRYILRGLAQGLCLVLALTWLMPRLEPGILMRHGILLLYLLFVSLLSVASPGAEVFFQVGSLAAVVLFAIAYAESQVDSDNRVLATTTAISYGVVALGSLIAAAIAPGLAYEQDIGLGSGHRFQGLFGEPGMMAGAAGILVGVGLFGVKAKWAKLLTVSPAIACLVLTGSRTFWLASFIAVIIVLFWCYPRSRKMIAVFVIILLMAAGVAFVFDVSIDTEVASSAFRGESISTLTGRTGVWAASVEAWKEKPLFGFGYTRGADGLAKLGWGLREYLPEYQVLAIQLRGMNFSLHSGYIQALLDTGIVGASLYVIVIVCALWRLYRSEVSRTRPLEHFLILFLLIANFSETIIYTASVFSSILFWFVAAYAMSLRSAPRGVGHV